MTNHRVFYRRIFNSLIEAGFLFNKKQTKHEAIIIIYKLSSFKKTFIHSKKQVKSKMKFSILSIIVLISLCLVDPARTISCYDCTSSSSGQACSDPFKSSANASITICDSNQTRCLVSQNNVF